MIDLVYKYFRVEHAGKDWALSTARSAVLGRVCVLIADRVFFEVLIPITRSYIENHENTT
jgi:hypothetical protein